MTIFDPHCTVPETEPREELIAAPLSISPVTETILEYTGERMVPEATYGQFIYVEHLARYMFAAQFTAGTKVLDFGSGEGYGAAYLQRNGAASVHAIDISPAAIEHASKKYTIAGLEYICADCLKAPFSDGYFDVVTSFEVIEHLTGHTAYIEEARRMIRKDGILVISTPNIAHSDGCNHFHLKELSLEEFTGLLQTHFKYVRIYSQTNLISSAVFDSNNSESVPCLTHTVEELPDQHDSLYFIAVCSDSEPSESINSSCLATIDAETPRLNRILKDTRHVVDEHIAVVREKDRIIAEKDRIVESLFKERAELMPIFGRYRDMLPCIDRSLKSLRNDSISSDSSLEIARLCLAANLADSARWFLNQVLRCDPEHSTCLLLMGQLYFQTGKNALAREYLTRVLQLEHNHPEAHALLIRLDEADGSPATRGE